MPHPALVPGAVAVITGGASGIGLATGARLAALGRSVCLADLGEDRLQDAAATLAAASLWAAGDIVANRPALSRWHPDFSAAFEAFVKEG